MKGLNRDRIDGADGHVGLAHRVTPREWPAPNCASGCVVAAHLPLIVGSLQTYRPKRAITERQVWEGTMGGIGCADGVRRATGLFMSKIKMKTMTTKMSGRTISSKSGILEEIRRVPWSFRDRCCQRG
jgi:hypothetical protein